MGTCPHAAGQSTPGGKWPAILCLRQLKSKRRFRWGQGGNPAGLSQGVRSCGAAVAAGRWTRLREFCLAAVSIIRQRPRWPTWKIRANRRPGHLSLSRKRQGVSPRLLLLANAANACLLWQNACPTMPFSMPEPCGCGCGACGQTLPLLSRRYLLRSNKTVTARTVACFMSLERGLGACGQRARWLGRAFTVQVRTTRRALDHGRWI